MISGFVLGVAGFLLMFKSIFLLRISPEDELAPGIVVIASVLNGLLFAFIGSLIQDHFVKKKNSKFKKVCKYTAHRRQTSSNSSGSFLNSPLFHSK